MPSEHRPVLRHGLHQRLERRVVVHGDSSTSFFFRSSACTWLPMLPTYSRLSTTAAVAAAWPLSSIAASSWPLVTSMTCKLLSQPATNVVLPATTGEPFTGPCVLNFHTSLP